MFSGAWQERGSSCRNGSPWDWSCRRAARHRSGRPFRTCSERPDRPISWMTMEDSGKMGKRHGLLLIATLGLALSFSGCGGGSTTGIFSGAPPPPSGIQQLFFADNATGATRGTLYAVESTIPTQPTIFTDNVNQRSLTMAYSGRFDAASQTVSGVAPYALVYERGGTLFRVDGNLSARQISQVGIADNLSSLGLRQ